MRDGAGATALHAAGRALGGGVPPFERLTALELLVGTPFGAVDPATADGREAPEVAVGPSGPSRADPRAVLEEVVGGALARPPCIVQFSGGRDSSALLAIAAHVARRRGLPLPVPVTFRYEDDLAAEAEWQELVVAHLGIDEWVRVEVGGELDVVGPVAGRLLDAYGLVPPAPLYTSLVVFELGRGGTRMTGEGGDDLLRARRGAPFLEVRSRPGALLRPGVARGVAAAALPRRVRGARWEHRLVADLDLPWLRPGVRREVVRRVAADLADEPVSWRRALARHGRNRGDHVFTTNSRLLAAQHDVVCVDPLLHPAVIEAVGRRFAPFGVRSRSEAFAALVGDLLPDRVVNRTTKAAFNRSYLTDAARAFARSWSGLGVDPDLVDVEALRAEWCAPVPSALSFALLQAAWLGEHGRAVAVAAERPERGRRRDR
ncbi:MAG: asparagine synthase-related protein [Actinomycetota bacterium]|nr:asparagine synthase-related protein [Actinomycetota bacterium]